MVDLCVLKLRRKGPAPFQGILGTIMPTKYESYAPHLCLYLIASLLNVSYLDKEVKAVTCGFNFFPPHCSLLHVFYNELCLEIFGSHFLSLSIYICYPIGLH